MDTIWVVEGKKKRFGCFISLVRYNEPNGERKYQKIRSIIIGGSQISDVMKSEILGGSLSLLRSGVQQISGQRLNTSKHFIVLRRAEKLRVCSQPPLEKD